MTFDPTKWAQNPKSPAVSAVSVTSKDMALLKLFQKAAESQRTNPAAASVVEDDETDVHSHLQDLDPTSITENPGKLESLQY